MSETVFILGAGASKHAGAPLMKDFLSTADNLRRSNTATKHIFDKVFNIIDSLQSVHSKSRLGLDNIENVFAALEMGQLIRKLPDIPDSETPELVSAMKQLITKTLEASIVFPVSEKQIRPPGTYDYFAKFVKAINNNGSQNNCSIITFNYDVALDYALHFNLYPPNYCLDNSNSGIPLLKLHGSINWARCTCGKIIPWNIGDYTSKREFISTTTDVPSQHYFHIGSELLKSGLKHCDKAIEPDPMIVPPTWNKQRYHNEIAQVWTRAAKELANAENIFIIGYSFPESDYFFHYLYALGSIGKTRIKRFWVCNSNREIANRFKSIIGQDVVDKFSIPDPGAFEYVLSAIRQQLKVNVP